MNWIGYREYKADQLINPVVGFCRVCSKAIYRLDAEISGSKNYCSEKCWTHELEQVLREFYERNKLRMVEG